MKNTKAISHIRQLCCLGVESHAVMPALVEALHDLIPSSNNLFIWTDDHGTPIERYCEVYIPAVVEAAQQDLPGKTDLKAIVKSGRTVGSMRERPAEFYKSPYFAEVYRPMRARHSLDAVIRTPRGIEGVLVLHRDSPKPFSQEEEQELESVLPYIRHIWTRPQSDAAHIFTDSDGYSTIVCDTGGKIQHMSQNASQLLSMAQQQKGVSLAEQPTHLPDELKELTRRLHTIATPGVHAGPPALYVNNRWGRFVFRATWLDSLSDQQDRMIAISITRQEPLAVSVVRGFQRSPLSPKQRDVALMLVTGRSAEDIVRELSISVTTYKDHLRKIYEKLGITKRVDLIRHLTQPSMA
jgi:DNA-binding CsgD family transcriptional regulator